MPSGGNVNTWRAVPPPPSVDLLDLDRLVRLFQAAQADAKARGFLADAITSTVTTPGGAIRRASDRHFR